MSWVVTSGPQLDCKRVILGNHDFGPGLSAKDERRRGRLDAENEVECNIAGVFRIGHSVKGLVGSYGFGGHGVWSIK